LVILLAIFWYGAVPVIGAFMERGMWRSFRRRFNELRQKPELDYAAMTGIGQSEEYRFYGVFESVSADGILWIRSGNLTVRADLRKAKTYIFPNTGRDGNHTVFDPQEAPEKINWNRISGLTGEAKVFVGGTLATRENRRIFTSLPEAPLLVIFYEGQEKALSVRAVRIGRHRNEFFNFLTPYAFIMGAFSQILIAINYLSRPAYNVTLIVSLIAFFAPLLIWAPPGILFTFIYRRIWFQARIYRAYRDLACFPLVYISPNFSSAAESADLAFNGESRGSLPNGEIFCIRKFETLPVSGNKRLKFFIPVTEKRPNDKWHYFGVLPNDKSSTNGQSGDQSHAREQVMDLQEPQDAFAVSGILPGAPESLAKRYTGKAYTLEVISWFFLLAGIGINLYFIGLIISLVQI